MEKKPVHLPPVKMIFGSKVTASIKSPYPKMETASSFTLLEDKECIFLPSRIAYHALFAAVLIPLGLAALCYNLIEVFAQRLVELWQFLGDDSWNRKPLDPEDFYCTPDNFWGE